MVATFKLPFKKFLKEISGSFTTRLPLHISQKDLQHTTLEIFQTSYYQSVRTVNEVELVTFFVSGFLSLRSPLSPCHLDRLTVLQSLLNALLPTIILLMISKSRLHSRSPIASHYKCYKVTNESVFT